MRNIKIILKFSLNLIDIIAWYLPHVIGNEILAYSTHDSNQNIS